MKSICLFALIALMLAAYGEAQTPTGALTREDVVRLTLANQPQIRQAEQGVAAAEARIGVSRAGLYPDVSLSGVYTRIGPVPSISLSPGETFRLYPYDNYDAHVELRQTLYDFGRNRASISAAEAARQTAGDYIDMVRLNLAYQALTSFNSILILQNTITVIDSQIAALQQHAAISAKRIQAGTATNYDTLTTQVRIAVATNDRTDAVRALNSQMIMLRQLTGLPENQPVELAGDFASVQAAPSLDSLMAFADTGRPELVLARDAERAAEIQARLTGLGDKPSLSLNVTSGFKNGYVPNLNRAKANYTAGVRFQMPLFNGHRTSFEETAAQANLQSAREHTADVHRQVIGDVQQALLNVQSSLNKIGTADLQIRQAEQAVAMANTRYEAGVITNVELLDAETILLQTRLIRLRALYDYTAGLTALDRAIGRKVW